jgi:hypothetical protein
MTGRRDLQTQSDRDACRVHRRVATPDRLDVAVHEWGRADDSPIVFVHELAQSRLCFLRQFGSDLATLVGPGDIKRRGREVVQRDRTLQADLEKKGVSFTRPDLDSGRDKLRAAGFYREWRDKIGPDAWAPLEKHVGKLA